jgi:hypothetical protein
MAPTYEKGQKIIITPPKYERLSPRDSDISKYAGRKGKVTDYYWMNTATGETVYIYTVQLEADDKDIVLHEDEMQAYME